MIITMDSNVIDFKVTHKSDFFFENVTATQEFRRVLTWAHCYLYEGVIILKRCIQFKFILIHLI